MEKFIPILKTSTKINGLIQISKKKSDEQNRFTYSATSPFFFLSIFAIYSNIVIHLFGHFSQAVFSSSWSTSSIFLAIERKSSISNASG